MCHRKAGAVRGGAGRQGVDQRVQFDSRQLTYTSWLWISLWSRREGRRCLFPLQPLYPSLHPFSRDFFLLLFVLSFGRQNPVLSVSSASCMCVPLNKTWVCAAFPSPLVPRTLC